MVSRTATVASAVGLHARPAAIFAQAVDDTGFDVTLTYGDEEADAASVIEVMALGVGHGDEVVLSCEDDAASDSLDALVELLGRDLDA
ncbi:HPr family phosphocarrier protein [Schaalia canis]|uniref:Phosphocarrier protein HPr n=1 Tax=Schaalia canis TaxID=100469 RepID=A0A3P1SFZ4_9ACTO|nr:HPr family phosphocarrier protein [Schaalia canis]RRC95897.1 HPr family phosphocarrier protein [Schaalia canis]